MCSRIRSSLNVDSVRHPHPPPRQEALVDTLKLVTSVISVLAAILSLSAVVMGIVRYRDRRPRIEAYWHFPLAYTTQERWIELRNVSDVPTEVGRYMPVIAMPWVKGWMIWMLAFMRLRIPNNGQGCWGSGSNKRIVAHGKLDIQVTFWPEHDEAVRTGRVLLAVETLHSGGKPENLVIKRIA